MPANKARYARSPQHRSHAQAPTRRLSTDRCPLFSVPYPSSHGSYRAYGLSNPVSEFSHISFHCAPISMHGMGNGPNETNGAEVTLRYSERRSPAPKRISHFSKKPKALLLSAKYKGRAVKPPFLLRLFSFSGDILQKTPTDNKPRSMPTPQTRQESNVDAKRRLQARSKRWKQ